MLDMQQQDIPTWNTLMQGNCSVAKSPVQFTAIGADHGIEQENKKMKIIGGIKGIDNNQRALGEFFLTAGNIGAIVEEFENIFQIRGNISGTKSRHYQLTGSKNKRISENMNKVMNAFNVSFNNSSNVYNIFTKKVMPQQFATKFLNLENIGEEKYHKFLEEQLNGEKSIWDKITKETS